MKTVFPTLLAAITLPAAALAEQPAQADAAKPGNPLLAQLTALESQLAGLGESLDQRKAEIERSHRRHHDEIDMYRDKAELLASRLAEVQKDNAAKAKRIADLEQQLADKTKSAEDAQAAVRSLKEQVAKLQAAAAPAPTAPPAPGATAKPE